MCFYLFDLHVHNTLITRLQRCIMIFFIENIFQNGSILTSTRVVCVYINV